METFRALVRGSLHRKQAHSFTTCIPSGQHELANGISQRSALTLAHVVIIELEHNPSGEAVSTHNQSPGIEASTT